MIPITIVKYKDAGKYTKSNPKREGKEFEADTEHEARRMAFDYLREDGWWALELTIEKDMV